ncbi:hypothetical protein NC651_027112 [Populus alba x Populus x berolinensis]|nr:hypothetical protein NC651_027112 [Populus alba x Populus x berolinensis]
MARRRLLLMLKPFDVYQFGQSNGGSSITNSQRKVHKDAINYCQDILRKKSNIDWEPILRTNLSQPIRNFDLVVTVVTIDWELFYKQVEKFSNEFDATRSTGYLCAATVQSFEQVRNTDGVNEGKLKKQA